MVKLVIYLLGVLLLTAMSFMLYSENDSLIEKEIQNDGLHQGPVPLGYNVSHFRLTGETIKEEPNGIS